MFYFPYRVSGGDRYWFIQQCDGIRWLTGYLFVAVERLLLSALLLDDRDSTDGKA